MRHVYRTIAVAVSVGFAALAVAQTSGAPNPGARGGTASSYYGSGSTQKPAITNPLNTTGLTRTAPRTGTGTRVTPVPEPSQWAMMLAGLALVGFIVRRSSKRS